MRPRPSTALALLLLLAPPPRAAAQDVTATDFGAELSVTVVQVPVRVHRDGVPVTGLTAADFEVYDEGERRELSSFEVVDLRPAGPGATSGAAAAEGATAQGRRLLLLIDFAYSPPQELLRALRGMERMVAEQLHPADRAAIATYSHRRGVQVLVGFTGDERELLSTLQTMRERIELGPRAARARADQQGAARRGPTVDLERLSARLGAGAALAAAELDPERLPAVRGALWSTFVATLPSVPFDDGTTLPDGPIGAVQYLTAEALADSVASDANMRTELTKMRLLASNLSGLATLLRGVGGQKLLLWVSRGFPAFLLDAQASAELETTLFEPFRRAGWQIETLDIRGIPDPFGDAPQRLGAPGAAPPLATVGFQAHTLLYVARGTGGEVYENYGDLADATKAVLARTELTYLLGFTVVDQPADSRYRRLEVRLRDGSRGARLSYREGYYTAKPERSRTELERRLDVAERIFGDEEGGTLAATAQAFPLRAGSPPGVSFFVEVPAAALGALAAGAPRTVRVRAYALDRSGVIAGAFSHQLEIGTGRRERGLRFYGVLPARPGDYRMRVAVEDVEGRRSWVGTLPLHVAAPDALALSPPFFVDDGSGWVVARHDAAAPASYPFTLGGRDVTPLLAPRLTPGDARGVLLVLDGEPPPGAALSGRVLTAAGEPTTGGGFEVVTREDAGAGRQRLVARLSTTDLTPGDYRLEVALAVGGTKTLVTTAPFRVADLSGPPATPAPPSQ
jgi:VWFA-related protein